MDANLILMKNDGAQKKIPVPSSVTVIGRRHDCDLRIPLMSISKRHCQLNHRKGVFMIRDLGSRNGTILNGAAVREAVIKAGDSLRIGPLAFVLQVDGKPKNPKGPKVKPTEKKVEQAKPVGEEASEFEEFEDLDSFGSEEFTALMDDADSSDVIDFE